jgi:cytochrome d ubiquinol oxidase subunit I
VVGLMLTEDAVSKVVKPGMVLTSMVIFTLLYGLLMVADVYLLAKYAKAGPQKLHEQTADIDEEKSYE